MKESQWLKIGMIFALTCLFGGWLGFTSAVTGEEGLQFTIRYCPIFVVLFIIGFGLSGAFVARLIDSTILREKENSKI